MLEVGDRSQVVPIKARIDLEIDSREQLDKSLTTETTCTETTLSLLPRFDTSSTVQAFIQLAQVTRPLTECSRIEHAVAFAREAALTLCHTLRIVAAAFREGAGAASVFEAS